MLGLAWLNGTYTRMLDFALVAARAIKVSRAFRKKRPFYEDWRRGNRRIDRFTEQPLVCYETGHRSALRPQGDPVTVAKEDVRLPLDRAVKYHLVMNMFYHPGSIVRQERTREAIREVVRYIDYIGANVLHLGNDAVAEWWQARLESRVERVATSPEMLRFRCDCRHPGGMVVMIPFTGQTVAGVAGAADDLKYDMREEFGARWLRVIVPHGAGEFTVHYR